MEYAPFLRYAFGRLLRMHGYDVREATDGREALDCVVEFAPEPALTDRRLPAVDGVGARRGTAGLDFPRNCFPTSLGG